jgi:hypothetical protein
MMSLNKYLKNFFVGILLILISVKASAQPYCNCNQLAKALIHTLETDYVEGDRLAYNQRYQQVKAKVNANKLADEIDDNCLFTIYSMVEALDDKHVSPRFYLNKAVLKKAFDAKVLDKIYDDWVRQKLRSDGVSGLWELHGGSFRYMVLKDSLVRNKYNVLVWSSINPAMKKGFSKGSIFRISKDSFMYKSFLDTNLVATFPLKSKERNLYNAITGEWQRKKDFSSAIAPPRQLTPDIKRLSANTLYIRFPSSSPTYRAPMDSLLRIYHDSLLQTEHLIIDIRDNSGGSRLTYGGLLKYIYDKPIRFDGYFYMASKENVIKLRESMNQFAAAGDSGMYRAFKENVEKLDASLGKKVLDSGFYINYDTVYSNPKRVSVIINNVTASAAEMLLMSAKQSGKVTVFGENSAGAVDRVDAYLTDCGCKNFSISIPISLRNPEGYLKPIDNIGIPPDVPIRKSKDWIQYVQEYYKNQ